MIGRIKKKDKRTGDEYFSVPFSTIREKIPDRMTPEMWQLYNLISERTDLGLITTVAQICEAVPYYQRKSVTKGNYSNCPELYEDVFLINTLYRGQHDKFILTNSNRFKLATKREALEKLKNIATKYYRLNWEMEALNSLFNDDGQHKILSNQGVPIYSIVDGKEIRNDNAKDYKETFVEPKLEELDLFQLRQLYLDLCSKTLNTPLKLSRDLYIKEIRNMQNEVKQQLERYR